jgi:hypothetical protein
MKHYNGRMSLLLGKPESFIHRQRELIGKIYGAVRTLRLVLANHPAAKGVEIPEWLFKGGI